MQVPLVSIIIPVYNGGNYLKSAIDSALNQTYKNCEVIVINDGSNDDGETEKIAISFGDKIKYYSKSNGGVATALNKGIQEMRGEYFSWLSHDDMYSCDKVEKEINAINLSGDLKKIVFSDYAILDVDNKEIKDINIDYYYSSQMLTKGIFPVIQGLIHGCTLLIHRSHFERVGLFDENLITTQDYDMWFRLFRNQKTIYIKQPLVIGRIHSAQGSKIIKTHYDEQYNLHVKFMELIDNKEMCMFFSNKYIFYYEMMNFYRINGFMQSYMFVYEKFKKEDQPKNAYKEINKLKKKLHLLSGGRTTKICIFCAGDFGKKLHQELLYRLIITDFFSDNNTLKWGEVIDGTVCISPLEIPKEETLIIVSMNQPETLLEELKTNGYPYVITEHEIYNLIKTVSPIKNIIVAESSKNNLNTSKESLVVFKTYIKTISEISEFYN